MNAPQELAALSTWLPQLSPSSPEPRIGLVGIAYVVLLGLLLPWGALRARGQLDGEELPTRGSLYLGLLLQLGVLGLVTGLVVWLEDAALAAGRLGPTTLVAVAIFLAVTLGYAWRRERGSAPENPLVAALTPRGFRAALGWIAICAAAALVEEIAWRGLLVDLLERAGAGLGLPAPARTPVAVALSALSFGVGHAVQSRSGMLAAFVGALGFHGLALLSGGLAAPIAAHFLYDLAAGFWISPDRQPEPADPSG